MTAAEILMEARSLISRPENWCQRRLADVNADGSRAFCAVGALRMVIRGANHTNETAVKESFSLLGEVTNSRGQNIADYNNGHSHECVLAAFDAAIEKALPPIPDTLPCGSELVLV